MKKVIPIILVMLLISSGCSGGDAKEAYQSGYDKGYADGIAAAQATGTATPGDVSVPASTPAPTAKPTSESKKPLTYGDTFEFDGFDITFAPEYEFTKIDNQFSELDGHDIIAFSITITNKSGATKSLNMFYFSMFLPDGTQADNCSSYFMEDDITWAGEMRDGATLNSKMHVPYSEDGTYYVEFDNFATEIEVELPVTKPEE